MATSSLAIGRRDRRRRQLAIVLTLAVIITVVALAVSYRTERRETAEYLALVDDVARSELAVSESLQDLFASISDLDRPAILGRIETLTAQAESIDETLAEAVVTRPVAEVHGYITVAATSWGTGIAAMDEAVVGVMDQPPGALPDGEAAPLDVLLETFDHLRVGDHAYRAFLEGVAALDPEHEAPSYPRVAFLGDDEVLDVTVLAEELRLHRELEERRDVGVTANTDPEPIGESNGTMVFPYRESFDVTAVVTNSGNVPQEGIELTVELRRDVAASEPFVESRIIASLEPRSSESVIFVGLPLEPDELYSLQVSVDIAEDVNPENNVWSISFATNIP